jgi:cytoskeletal protein RodZ
MAVVFDPGELTDLGSFLRDGRERRGMTLDQIASATRIPRRHLNALEHGELDALPSGMYRRAEVRAFADAVGIDPNIALAHLDQALDQRRPAEKAPRPPLEESRRLWGAYAALALLAAVTIVISTRAQWLPSQPVTDAVATPEPVQQAGIVAARETPVPVPASTTVQPPPAALASAPGRAASPRVEKTAAAATAPAAIALAVTSSPEGARVLVDGIGWGHTPVTLRTITPGNRRIRVVLDGYVSRERVVRVGQGATKVHVDLVPAN